MFVSFMPYDARLVLFKCAAWTNQCLAQILFAYRCLFWPCLYLACCLRKDYIFVFRLAQLWLLRTAPYSRLHLGVGLATNELNSNLDPWQLGLATHFSIGYKQAPRPAGRLGGQRGPQEFSQGCKAATPGSLEQPTSRDEDRAEA